MENKKEEKLSSSNSFRNISYYIMFAARISIRFLWEWHKVEFDYLIWRSKTQAFLNNLNTTDYIKYQRMVQSIRNMLLILKSD